MDARQNAAEKTTLGLGWARRVLRQQLDALLRLADVAKRLMQPAAAVTAPVGEPPAFTTLWTRLCGLEKALRLHERVLWANRLIVALRARLAAELEAVDNGQAPTPPDEACGADAKSERHPEKADPAERQERPERPERERFEFQRRGSDKALARILKLPTAEIIALICRKLGLPEDWPSLAEEAWAREQADDDWTQPPPRGLKPAPTPSPPRIVAAPS